ncbi:MAG: MFS transporter [Acidobacteria bacterium]|jgi:MFS family permease|nr:MFS transporter [Acidobacteriota bacterium]MCU0254905.1 MFS transporter [Acidobacteriota bacterium]
MTADAKRHAWRAIVLFGVVSLFADITYEGARSISGPFLESLGASAVVVGFAAGAGELIAYGLRLASGIWADRSRRYWTLTVAGYAINLLAVPLLALAGAWPVAVLLLLVERFGKALRNPSRDAILAGAALTVGTGRGFALHEALDQIGAVAGPLIVSAALAARLGADAGFRAGFAILLVPALLALATLSWARRETGRLEPRSKVPHDATREPLPRAYWYYLASAALLAAGLADFPLLAFRLAEEKLVPGSVIPLLYAAAMAADAVAALAFGWLFDRFGFGVLGLAGLLAVPATALAFLGPLPAVVAGVLLWGAALGAHESVVRAGVAQIAPRGRHGTAFGIFYAAYGGGWFVGSALMGLAYERSPIALVALSAAFSLAALGPLLGLGRRSR